MTIGGVILAAGSSSRLGTPKQEVVLGGETLLGRAVRTARDAGLEPLIVVVRDTRWGDQLESLGVKVLHNEHAHGGMGTSVVVGVAWAESQCLRGLVLMTCDQPALRPEHLRALCLHPERTTGSRYAGRIGVPAYFPASSFGALLQLRGDAGARTLLHNAAAIDDENLALDIDTTEDLARAQRRFASP